MVKNRGRYNEKSGEGGWAYHKRGYAQHYKLLDRLSANKLNKPRAGYIPPVWVQKWGATAACVRAQRSHSSLSANNPCKLPMNNNDRTAVFFVSLSFTGPRNLLHQPFYQSKKYAKDAGYGCSQSDPWLDLPKYEVQYVVYIKLGTMA